MDMKVEARERFNRINAILAALTPEGQEAWMRKGEQMANMLQIMETTGFRVVPQEVR